MSRLPTKFSPKFPPNRWKDHVKPIPVEDTLRFKPSDLWQGGGWLRWSDSGQEWSITYQIVSQPDGVYTQLAWARGDEHYEQWVQLVNVPTPWGAYRREFLCPECGRQCRKLYIPLYADRFACRLCHQLGYASRQVPVVVRQIVKEGSGLTMGEWKALSSGKVSLKMWRRIGKKMGSCGK